MWESDFLGHHSNVQHNADLMTFDLVADYGGGDFARCLFLFVSVFAKLNSKIHAFNRYIRISFFCPNDCSIIQNLVNILAEHCHAKRAGNTTLTIVNGDNVSIKSQSCSFFFKNIKMSQPEVDTVALPQHFSHSEPQNFWERTIKISENKNF